MNRRDVLTLAGTSAVGLVATTATASGTTASATPLTASDVELEVRIDGTLTDELGYHSSLLLPETVTIETVDSGEIIEAEADTDATITVADGVTLDVHETGDCTVSLAISVESEPEPIQETVSLTAYEYRSELPHFDFMDGWTDTREWTVYAAQMQESIETDYRHIAQRLDGLPETIEVHPTDADDGAFARFPNEIHLTYPDLDQQSVPDYGFGARNTTRHEIVHIGQYEMNMETRGDWNFLLEGQAVFEQVAWVTYDPAEERPDQSYLLDWDRTSEEYQVAEQFVHAFFAEYGRETFHSFVRNSSGRDMKSEFEDATGESFDAFYARWADDDPETDPGRIRGTIPYRIRFEHHRGTLRPVIFGWSVSDSATVTWDVTGDGTVDYEGETVEWKPDEAGTYDITVRHEIDGESLEQTQSVYIDPTPELADYADEETGAVETDGLRSAIDDWRSDNIETGLLRDVIDAWRGGEPLE